MCWGQSRAALPGPDASRCGLQCHAMQPRLSLDPETGRTDVAVYPVWTAVSVDIFSKENTTGRHPWRLLYLPGHLSRGSEAATQRLALTITGAPPTFPPGGNSNKPGD
eukprot:superscaffoldBa00002242_g13630